MTELFLPGDIHKPKNPFGVGHYWMNAGLVEHWGKTWIVSRVGRIPAMLAIHELGNDWEVSETRLLFGCNAANIVAEDPRVVPCGDRLAIWYVGITQNPNCSMAYAEVDRQWQVHRRQLLKYVDPEEYILNPWRLTGISQQKNWVPFSIDGRVYCIYNHDPFTVLERMPDGKMQLAHTGPRLRWDFGAIRGGAPPVLKDGLWHSFFHSSRFEGDPDWPVKVYYSGCYTFDDEFTIYSMTLEPILGGNENTWTQPWDGRGKISACFPCGAILKNDRWLISYGWLDSEVRLAEFSHADLEPNLISLKKLDQKAHELQKAS